MRDVLLDKYYVMLWSESAVQFVGPFNSQIKATEYGTNYQNENDDDPRWQVMHCANGKHLSIEMVAP